MADDLANLRNLTSLWTALGASSRCLSSGTVLHRSLGWPHRLWFDPDVSPTHDDVHELVADSRATPASVVPDWGSRSGDLGSTLVAAGFALASEQTLMALRREPRVSWNDLPPGPLVLHDAAREVTTWAHTASVAFGYEVDPASIDRLGARAGARLLLARVGARVVGTGLLFEADGVAGLHMVGVVPEARRTGLARHIMHGLLARTSLPLVTLQASPMGEPLYRELGFMGASRVCNHALPSP